MPEDLTSLAFKELAERDPSRKNLELWLSDLRDQLELFKERALLLAGNPAAAAELTRDIALKEAEIRNLEERIARLN